jgi:MYXO-CTERM domain-containing protein
MADDFWRSVARGLQFAGWRPGTGDIGVSRHVAGDGWSVQTVRLLDGFEVFGGVAGFEFNSAVNPLTGARVSPSLTTELSIRTAAIPTARLRVATDQTGTDTPVPVEYNFWVFTGAQDVSIEGQASIEAEVLVNALGFYEIDAFVSNRGEFEIDGLLYSDAGTLDFDLGPISLSGNIFADAVAAVTAPLFLPNDTSNPMAVFSGRAKLQDQMKRRDELVARIEAGEVLSDEEMNEIITTSMLESVLGGSGSDLVAMATEALQSSTGALDEGAAYDLMAPVPEPVSAAWWLLLAVVAGGYRRRRS